MKAIYLGLATVLVSSFGLAPGMAVSWFTRLAWVCKLCTDEKSKNLICIDHGNHK